MKTWGLGGDQRADIRRSAGDRRPARRSLAGGVLPRPGADRTVHRRAPGGLPARRLGARHRADLSRAGTGGAGRSASAADRLARQAALYGSRFEVQAEADGRAVFHNRHCAIWDYRERARARGVPITLESACTYCTKLLSAFVAASDCRADWRLYEEPQAPRLRMDHHGGQPQPRSRRT
ncbi:hypothetical protein N5K55_09145 [Pseudomonas aeruginosa]|nr:hypothetical protein [Pseudomonas aeruginosa]